MTPGRAPLSPSAATLAFVHIEKTAGTTLIHILRQTYFPHYVDVRPLTRRSGSVFTPDDLRRVRRWYPSLRAFGGHAVVPYAGLEEESPDIKYVTLLRDPVSRFVSQYAYWIERMGASLPFEEFLANRRTWNVQTRRIVGSADWSRAAEVLETRFVACGLTERFDEFLAALSLRLDGERLRTGHKSVNPGRGNVVTAELIDRFRSQIEAANSEDIALYRHVADVHWPRVRAVLGHRLDQRLVELQRQPAGWERSVVRLADFAMRKAVVDPAMGIVRRLNGLTYRGSYGRIEQDWA